MKQIIFIITLLFTFQVKAQIVLQPSPKIDSIGVVTGQEWIDFYMNQPVIFIKLKKDKVDFFCDGYKKGFRYCYYWWYKATKVDDLRNIYIVRKYTYKIKKSEIARP